MKTPSCRNPACSNSGRPDSVIRHGFYRTKSGSHRRRRCQSCRKTFCSRAETPYYRLQHRRSTFDEVAALSVEGVSKSAIARVKGLAWNTVDRWLEKAAVACRQFNNRTVTQLDIPELQADEIRTIVTRKDQPVWVFATLDVWSGVWPSIVVGRRSYRNTRVLLRDSVWRMVPNTVPLIVTDGFELYERVVREVFGRTCLYGQVVKM